MAAQDPVGALGYRGTFQGKPGQEKGWEGRGQPSRPDLTLSNCPPTIRHSLNYPTTIVGNLKNHFGITHPHLHVCQQTVLLSRRKVDINQTQAHSPRAIISSNILNSPGVSKDTRSMQRSRQKFRPLNQSQSCKGGLHFCWEYFQSTSNLCHGSRQLRK